MSFSCQSLYPQTLHEHVSQWAYTICYLHAVCLYHVTMYTYSITSVPTAEWRPRPHGYVFKICVFISLKTELRPHDRFQIVLPVHTKTIQVTENATNLTLRMSRKLSCFHCRPSWIFSHGSALGLRSHDQLFSKVCVFGEFDPSTRNRCCCVFKSFHSGERFQKFAFSSKRIHRFYRFHHFRVDSLWKRIRVDGALIASRALFAYTVPNRQFPSCILPLFQSES